MTEPSAEAPEPVAAEDRHFFDHHGVDPGSSFTAQGTGFARCFAGWYVTIGAARSEPQSGSVDDRRSVSVTVPSDTPPGPQNVQAWCDLGTGARPVAEATLTVNGATTTSTTSPPPATSTVPPTTTTTPPTKSSITTSTPSTTTTTTPGP